MKDISLAPSFRQLGKIILAKGKASVRGIFAEFTSVKRRRLNEKIL